VGAGGATSLPGEARPSSPPRDEVRDFLEGAGALLAVRSRSLVGKLVPSSYCTCTIPASGSLTTVPWVYCGCVTLRLGFGVVTTSACTVSCASPAAWGDGIVNAGAAALRQLRLRLI
jgi:hypothetical protein